MTDYNKLKVVELKELIKERGITATGLTKKAQFIEALEQEDAKVETLEEVAPAVEEVADEPPTDDTNGTHQAVEESALPEKAATADAVPLETSIEAPQVSDSTDDSNAQKTVLESHVPVSDSAPLDATTLTNIETEDTPSSESRKRKRRSPTPPVSEESVQKKLKATENGSEKPPEEATVEATPTPLEVATKTHPIVDTSEDVEMSEGRHEEPAIEAVDETIAQAKHPATNALYIRNIMRPLQPQTFRAHLESLGSSVIKELYLDSLKTHAFALFSSTEQAVTVRNSLHDRVWPEETQRKPLWVDFIPENKVQVWIDEELDAGRNRRYEVVYHENDAGEVIAELQEAEALSAPPRQPSFNGHDQPQDRIQGQGQGMPGAPSGPRANRPASSQLPPTGPAASKPQSASFNKLDARFQFSAAKPKLYYQPVEKDLVDRRLEELDRHTSRAWNGGQVWNRNDSSAPLDQLVRYTFEDGKNLVTVGNDFGGFGRRQGAGGSGRPPIPSGGGYGGRGGGFGGGGGRRYRP